VHCFVSLSTMTCSSIQYFKIFTFFCTFDRPVGCTDICVGRTSHIPMEYETKVDSSFVMITRFKPRGHLSPSFPSFYLTKKKSPHSVVPSGTFLLACWGGIFILTAWSESLSPWQRLVMNKIKGKLVPVPQHRVIWASRGHGGEAVYILYFGSRGQWVVSFTHRQFCGRRKRTEISEYSYRRVGAPPCRYAFLNQRNYRQVVFIARIAMHIFH
jgi:hypothetical protein